MYVDAEFYDDEYCYYGDENDFYSLDFYYVEGEEWEEEGEERGFNAYEMFQDFVCPKARIPPLEQVKSICGVLIFYSRVFWRYKKQASICFICLRSSETRTD